jgi:quercetin dioxygenase-like cupin family protein
LNRRYDGWILGAGGKLFSGVLEDALHDHPPEPAGEHESPGALFMIPTHKFMQIIPSDSRAGAPYIVVSGNVQAACNSKGEAMEIKRSGSRPSGKGPAEYFTGAVRIDPLFEAPEPARVRGASVTFEPGARTAWHTHPLGQTLIVTSGTGWVQRWGGPVQEIRPGDVVWFEPGEKHWHGATRSNAMTHIAIQEALNGSPVDWMEQVSDQQYPDAALAK